MSARWVGGVRFEKDGSFWRTEDDRFRIYHMCAGQRDAQWELWERAEDGEPHMASRSATL